MTEHQRGLVKALSRSALEEYFQDRLVDEIVELIDKNLQSNNDLFEILGQFDNWGDAKSALKILKGEKKVCVSAKNAAGLVARTGSR